MTAVGCPVVLAVHSGGGFPGYAASDRVPEQIEARFCVDSDEQLETFRVRAVPQPGGVLREASELTNDARLDVPSTVICTGYPSEAIKGYVTGS